MIKEELNEDTIVEYLLTTVEYDYSTVHLSMERFWEVLVEGPVKHFLVHEAAKWLSIETIDEVDWLKVDRKKSKR